MTVSAQLNFIVKYMIRHNKAHEVLLYLYGGPTSIQSRDIIHHYETYLCLPVTSCFLGNYRVGFGNIQDFLWADPNLRERAYRAEIQGTTIAHLPAWVISIQNDHDSVYAPPLGWQDTLPRANEG